MSLYQQHRTNNEGANMKIDKLRTQNTFKKKKLSIATGVLLGTLTIGMATSSTLFADSTANKASTTSSAIAGTLPDLRQMIKANRSSVVSIKVKMGKTASTKSPNMKRFKKHFEGMPKEFSELFKNFPNNPRGYDFGPRKSSAHGSGFIISEDGYIVTNTHVIDGASEIIVKTDDKRELQATLVGSDKHSDIALLKVEAENLPFVKLGDSDKLDVGQWVVAIGTPFGLDYTATQGIVSALSRSLPADTYVPFIQTDAAVNPGNSGGPLFDLEGKVVGVNSQIYSRSGGYMGVSFAIPSNIVKNVTEQLKTSGKVSRGWLGVGIQGVDESLAKSLGLDNVKGSLISSVTPSSPADKGGLQAGDLILGFDGKEVSTVSDLPILVGNTPIGKKVDVDIIRSGSAKTLEITVEKLKSKNDEPAELAKLEKGSLGVAVSALNDQDRAKLKEKSGVKVADVLADSPAEEAGLKTGDIIISVDGESIESPEKLKATIKAANANKPLAILLKRGDQALFVAVDLNT